MFCMLMKFIGFPRLIHSQVAAMGARVGGIVVILLGVKFVSETATLLVSAKSLQ